MKKALLLAPMASVHRRFNWVNIRVLLELGYEVHLAANFEVSGGTENQNQEYVEECHQRKIITHSIPYKRHSLFGNLALIGPTRKLIRQERFDLVHAHTETGGLLLRLAMLFRCKPYMIYTPHGMSFFKGSSLKSQIVYRPVEHWICAGMGKNLAINQEEYNVISAWKKSSACFIHGIGLNVEHIRNPLTERKVIRDKYQIPYDATLMLSIGELDDNKNHISVIRALRAMRRPDLYYLVCGVGPKRDMLQSYAEENGLGGKVILAGYRKDIPDIVNASDIFVFPSIHEGLPVSLMEAMAGGLPVICSGIRGNCDLIRDGVDGFLFAPENVDELTEKLGKMLSDVEFRKTFGQAGSEKIFHYYTEQNVADELRGVYNWIG